MVLALYGDFGLALFALLVGVWVPISNAVAVADLAQAALLLDLSAIKTGALLCFTALPTANSCYILAVRMGGNGPAVADLTTIQTTCSLVTIPLWMALVQALAL